MNIIFFHPGWLYGTPVLSSPWVAMKVHGLGLAEMEFIVPTGALAELCPSGGWKGAPHTQRFGPCWAGLAQCQGCLSKLSLTNRLGVGRIWGGERARRADPKCQNAIKAKRKKEVRGICFNIYLPEQPLRVLKLCFLERGCTFSADGK